MARPLRIEFSGAIYHVMSRGNARQDIVLDDTDCRRLTDGLERAVDRCAWEVFSFVLMTNHFHALIKTPDPNLSRGMQQWLSGYANWWCKRHGRPGHVFQGRFKADLVEDDSYFWTVSRYIHLNPVRAGLATHPAEWPWSSYLGYADRRRKLPWIRYESVWDAWQGEYGGPDPVRAYRQYVEHGIQEPPSSPFEMARHGWILGSAKFADRLRQMIVEQDESHEVPLADLLRGLEVSLVCQVVASHYGVDESALRQRSRHTEPRSLVAWLAKRHTSATLSELARALGLGRPQSVGNLTRRVETALPTSPKLVRTIKQLEQQLIRRHEEILDDADGNNKKKK